MKNSKIFLLIIFIVALFAACGKMPVNLEESMIYMDNNLSAEQKSNLKASSENELDQFHYSIGMWVRNKIMWGNKNEALVKFFTDLGVPNKEEMSNVILVSYWRKMHNIEIDLEGQVKSYTK